MSKVSWRIRYTANDVIQSYIEQLIASFFYIPPGTLPVVDICITFDIIYTRIYDEVLLEDSINDPLEWWLWLWGDDTTVRGKDISRKQWLILITTRIHVLVYMTIFKCGWQGNQWSFWEVAHLTSESSTLYDCHAVYGSRYVLRILRCHRTLHFASWSVQ